MSGKIAKANNIEIWYETFGQKSHPAILLIMGSCCQGVLWPTEFCEQLANEGFFIIRYDHRDAGFSTSFEFEKDPYDLLDMAKDALGLLDYIGVEKLHLFGLSGGGIIAQLMAVYFPERILSIAIMATSCDFRPLHLALDGLPPEPGSLSSPREDYLIWMNQLMANPPKNGEEKLQQRVEGWHMLSGFAVPFENERYRELHAEFLSRMRHPDGIKNHILANKRSEELVRSAPHHVKPLTLIFHGSEDPIFPPDHGEALAKSIVNSKYVFLKGMGHIPNSYFYDRMIDEMKQIYRQK